MASPLPSFDVLMELAQNNPEQLETLRKTLTDEIIHRTSPHMRQRLEGINFKIDMERQRCKTPLQSCIKIAALMHDSFEQMRTELDALFQPFIIVNKRTMITCPYRDNVIPFNRHL